jgi:serine/threonine protein kinase
MASSLIGRTLGKYEIIELLGQGGMATVYKGYQSDIDRYVAIKVLPPHPGQDPQYVERFRLEARTIARLQHPHILPLYDYGTQDDILYLATAYVSGGSLEEVIAEGPLPIPRVEKILREVGSALDYAHRQGVIHRDIKPGNILLDTEGHALLADFGIAKLVEGESTLTGTGGIVGTPAYIAPEQTRAQQVDRRADLYSLGVVVFEMITGRQPYPSTTPMDAMLKHMNAPIPRLAEVLDSPPSTAVEAFIQRALAKEPQDRFLTARDMVEAFSRAIHSADSYVGLEQPSVTVETPMVRDPLTFEPTPTPALTQPQPTIVFPESKSPVNTLLLGGFALIALIAAVAVIAVVGSQNRGQNGAVTPASSLVSSPTVNTIPAVPTAIPKPSFGTVTFSTANTVGDTVQLQVKDLKPLQPGERYAAWLKNTDDGKIMSLGALVVDAFGTGSLTYIDDNGSVLPAQYNALLISRESSAGTPEASTGKVDYSAAVPIELTNALHETLVQTSADIPSVDSSQNKTTYSTLGFYISSLLNGATTEATTAVKHTGLQANADTVGGMHTHAEHTINILMGTQVDYDGNGRGENPGRKLGVPFFIDKIDAALDAAMHAPSASLGVQSNGEFIRVCTQNVRERMNRIIDLEKQIVAAPDLTSVNDQKRQSTELAKAIIDGVDLNQNGQVEPFEGECGLKQISTYGILTASMDIVEGDSGIK